MADLSTVHPIAAGLQGIQQGIQNAGQLYGLMRQKRSDEMAEERFKQEESLMPLKEEALRQQVGLGKTAGEKAGIELQALKDYNTPLKFDEVMTPFREADKIGTTLAEEIAVKGGYLDPTTRTIKKGDLAKVRELSSTPEMMKQRALLNLEDINRQLKTIKPEDPIAVQLTEKKNYLEKMYKLEEDFEAVPVWNDKAGSWEWVNKKNGQPVPSLTGKTPKEVQVELLKEDAATDKAAAVEAQRGERAEADRKARASEGAMDRASRERAAATRAAERNTPEKAQEKKVKDKVNEISRYIYDNYDKKIAAFKKELAKVDGVDGKETSANNLRANIEAFTTEREKAVATQNMVRDGALKPEDVKWSAGAGGPTPQAVASPAKETALRADLIKNGRSPADADAYIKKAKELGKL